MTALSDFHFIRPELLIGVLIGPLLVYLAYKFLRVTSAWQNILPHHLQIQLNQKDANQHTSGKYWWLGLATIVVSIAAAGPAWQQLPQPVYQTQTGKVIVIDMSMSMRSTDVTPDRLTRARFKAIDLLQLIDDGEIGLVAYAGDAFVISPLTTDIENIQNLIPSLTPEIMPVLGSNPLSGLAQASELLTNSGYPNGEIYWITDGIEYADIPLIQEFQKDNAYSLSALLVGTDSGAPIRQVDGSLLKDSTGNIVIPSINENYFVQALNSIDSKVTTIANDSSDIENMVFTERMLERKEVDSEQQQTGDIYKDMGSYVALLLLPILAYFFRRGVLFAFVFVMVLPTDNAIAQTGPQSPSPETASPEIVSPETASQNTASSALADIKNSLFLNKNQQAMQLYNRQEFERATSLFEDTEWKANAAYKAGDYATASDLYANLPETTDSQYNYGNALAKSGQLEDALAAYNRALELDPSNSLAAKNRQIVEDLLNNQNQQQQDDSQDQQGQQSSEDESDKQNEESSGQDSENQQNSPQNSEQNAQSEPQDQEGQAEQNQSSESSNPQQEQSNSAQNTTPPEPQEQQTPQTEQNEQQPSEQNDDSSLEPNQQDSVQPIQADNRNIDELSPEEREKLQQLQTLLNKVPDDPAFLLQRKMQLEAEYRRMNRMRMPANQNQQTW